MSLVDHPLTTPVAAPKTTHLERNTPSEAVYDQYDEHADRYEPAGSPPSQEGQLETEHWKTPQYTRNNGRSPEPRRRVSATTPRIDPNDIYLDVSLLGTQHGLFLGHGRIGGVLQFIIKDLNDVNTWAFQDEGSVTSMGTSLLPDKPHLQI